MNNMQIKDKIKNIIKNKNIDYNTILRLFMYDRFIERLATSKYKDNFILKGGFYLSTLFGVQNRSTMDIDTAFRNSNFNQQNIEKIIKEIIEIDIKDNATLTLSNISPIRDEDEYGGYRVSIIVTLDNIRENFHIDIATGDPITPKAIIYKYIPILGNNYINLWAYNIETVLAEKLETILSRAETNSRIRDYYDIYLIYTRYSDKINKEYLNKAVNNTFKKRNYTGDINKTINLIKNSTILKVNWYRYSKKNSYAKAINYNEIMNVLEQIINIVDKIETHI